jgi:hypothetical protein
VVIQNNQKEFKTESGNIDNLLASLKNGGLDAVIVIPAGMDTLGSGQSDNIQVYYDASLMANQQTLIPAIYQVINAIDQKLGGYTPLIGMQQKSVQSHQLRYIDFLLPGILGMTLMFIGVQGGLPIIQQRQAHIIKRLGSTPLRRSMLVLGDVVFRMIVVLLSAALIILVGRLVFNVRMVGNWLSLCGIILLGSLVLVTGIGNARRPDCRPANDDSLWHFFPYRQHAPLHRTTGEDSAVDLPQRCLKANHGSRNSSVLHDHGYCRIGCMGNCQPRCDDTVLPLGLNNPDVLLDTMRPPVFDEPMVYHIPISPLGSKQLSVRGQQSTSFLP